MKPKLLILLLLGVGVMWSCSAKRQLTNLLDRHPELVIDSVPYTVSTHQVLEAKSNAIDIPISALVSATTSHSVSLQDDEIKPYVQVTAGAASALLYVQHDTLKLKVKQNPDTIYIEKQIKVPRVEVIAKKAPGYQLYVVLVCALLLVVIYFNTKK